MMTTPVVPMKSRVTEASSRRRSHGGSAWQLASNLVQPQDGASASDMKARVASIASKLQPAMPFESEDARLTGSTRNLFRRLMGLNVMTVQKPTNPATALMVRKSQRTVEIGSTQKVA